MRRVISSAILSLLLLVSLQAAGREGRLVQLDFYGERLTFVQDTSHRAPSMERLTEEAVGAFYEQLDQSGCRQIAALLENYRKQHQPDDWMYYQLIRKTAQALYPKEANYYSYTLMKCYLLGHSGFGVALNQLDDKLLFFVQSADDIYDVPSFTEGGKRYVCLNYHDYGYTIDFKRYQALRLPVASPDTGITFSYKLSRLPHFSAESYQERELSFRYRNRDYRFKVKLNEEVRKIFTNYPVADYQLYFDQPLSQETYNSLIPQLREQMKGMSQRQGIDYLMHFTRYAFSYETDMQHFGREKHLIPEQTLLYDRSDCEDRAALFYCLVKEIYDIPMIVVAFPNHLTVAVKLDQPVGKQIVHHGLSYSVCEPTPQASNLPIGRLSRDLRTHEYQIALHYTPTAK